MNASTTLEPTTDTSKSPTPADPRTRRTRELLQRSLATLLNTRDFDTLSIQDITDAATVNRATFYAHYPDKFALLECMVATRFHALLDSRGIEFNGCTSALRGMVLGVCDYLAQSPAAGSSRQLQMEPHIESAVVAVVRNMLLEGLQQHPTPPGTTPELLAATIAWAIYGAAKEWFRTPDRVPSEAIAETVVRLIAPLLQSPYGPADTAANDTANPLTSALPTTSGTVNT